RELLHLQARKAAEPKPVEPEYKGDDAEERRQRRMRQESLIQDPYRLIMKRWKDRAERQELAAQLALARVPIHLSSFETIADIQFLVLSLERACEIDSYNIASVRQFSAELPGFPMDVVFIIAQYYENVERQHQSQMHRALETLMSVLHEKYVAAIVTMHRLFSEAFFVRHFPGRYIGMIQPTTSVPSLVRDAADRTMDDDELKITTTNNAVSVTTQRSMTDENDSKAIVATTATGTQYAALFKESDLISNLVHPDIRTQFIEQFHHYMDHEDYVRFVQVKISREKTLILQSVAMARHIRNKHSQIESVNPQHPTQEEKELPIEDLVRLTQLRDVKQRLRPAFNSWKRASTNGTDDQWYYNRASSDEYIPIEFRLLYSGQLQACPSSVVILERL